MHHYDFHIGDYMKATAHLSNEEDLCYRRLLDMYYDTELPIPKETQWVSRRLRIGIEVVSRVLQDFFVLQDDGWHSLRCDEEIAHYNAICERNRQAGKLGGRPKKTQMVSKRKQLETVSNPNHEPLTNSKPTVDHEKIVFDGRSFQNINGQFEVWTSAFPAVDVQGELNRAAAWLIANPKNQKSNYARFLTNWLSRAQDKAPAVKTSAPPGGII
jgi:uncharacterized protein YdaU (DUF1376 family)